MKKTASNHVTLKDIARETGLSVTAVSKALNGKGSIGEDTIARVKDVAKKLNYTPNNIAKSLKSNQTKTIGVIVADSYTAFFPNVVRGIEDAASSYGYSMILSITDNDIKKERQSIKLLVDKRVDGILLISSMLTSKEDLEYLNSFCVPFVYLVRKGESQDADCVVNDYEWGAYIATRHLIKTFDGPIFLLNLSKHILCNYSIFCGYMRALKEAGIEFDKSWQEFVWVKWDDGYVHMRRIIERGVNKGAVLCGCDEIAIGAMEAIFIKGLRVPDDFRIAGYDDIDYAGFLRIPLTTVSQPKYIMGYKGMELLHNKIEADDSWKPQNIILKPELVIRQST